MMQSALQKERREIKQVQREAEADSAPTGVHKNWFDPMPQGTTPRPAYSGGEVAGGVRDEGWVEIGTSMCRRHWVTCRISGTS